MPFSKYFLAILGCILGLIVSAKNARASQDVEFSQEELEWIRNNPEVFYSGDPDWAPYDFSEDGEHKGISKNYLDRLSHITGLKFTYIPSDSWTGLRTLFQEGKTILVSSIAKNKTRERLLVFTDPYLSGEFVIVTSDHSKRIFDENDLAGLKIGVVKGYWITDQLQKRFRRFDYVDVPTIPQGFESMDHGEIDAMVMDFTVAMYFIEKGNYSDLKMIPSIFEEIEIHMAALPEYDLLISIINKGLRSLTPVEKAEMRREFFEVSLQSGIKRKYIRFFSIGLIGLGVVIIFVIFWNQSLQKEIRSRKSAENKLIQANINLKSKSESLDKALGDLKETQSQLVQAEKLSAIGQISAVVNHEVNNMLNYLKASIPPLKRDIRFLMELPGKSLSQDEKKELDEVRIEAQELIENLEQGSTHAGEIIAEIGEFGKEGNRERRPTNLNEIIESSLKLMAQSIEEGIVIETDLQSDRIINAAASQLKQMFINLFRNAITAMGSSGILRVKTEDSHDGTIKVSISDSGKGFHQSDKERIFEPFFTSNEKAGGTGMGLAIVKKIIAEHEGQIEAEGNPGKGATFTLTFPEMPV